MKFSQRMGITPITKSIQVESLDQELRNGLWNIFNDSICRKIDLSDSAVYVDGFHEALIFHLWHHVFKLPIDNGPKSKYSLLDFFRKEILEKEWYKALELIEETVSFCCNAAILHRKEIEAEFNSVFEREFSAYRFINGLIAPISNDQEVLGIEDALIKTKSYTALIGCNTHLEMALKKVSDKHSPDYRNSIKESISAVESLAKTIAEDGNTLGKALKVLDKKISIHPSLISGFSGLYGYTNDSSGGIRHALMSDESPCDFEDAKYMLISCSAFINYLISKANKAGITFQ